MNRPYASASQRRVRPASSISSSSADRSERADADVTFEQEGVLFYVDGPSVDDLQGTTLDYARYRLQRRLQVRQPEQAKAAAGPGGRARSPR